jgi:hypothetical protein
MSGKGSRPRPYSVDLNTFDNNWDAIFGKSQKADDTAVDAYNDERLVSKYDKESMTPSVKQMRTGSCGCGRSPTGDCCGWHGLTHEDYLVKLDEYNAQNNTRDTTQGG